MQTVKIGEIKLYAFSQEFHTEDGIVRFGGHLPASSWAQAEQMVREIGAEFEGELVSSVCATCGAEEYYNALDPQDDSILEQDFLA